MVNKIAGTSTISARRADRVKTSRSPRCRSCQAETASMMTAPVVSDAKMTLA